MKARIGKVSGVILASINSLMPQMGLGTSAQALRESCHATVHVYTKLYAKTV